MVFMLIFCKIGISRSNIDNFLCVFGCSWIVVVRFFLVLFLFIVIWFGFIFRDFEFLDICMIMLVMLFKLVG